MVETFRRGQYTRDQAESRLQAIIQQASTALQQQCGAQHLQPFIQQLDAHERNMGQARRNLLPNADRMPSLLKSAPPQSLPGFNLEDMQPFQSAFVEDPHTGATPDLLHIDHDHLSTDSHLPGEEIPFPPVDMCPPLTCAQWGKELENDSGMCGDQTYQEKVEMAVTRSRDISALWDQTRSRHDGCFDALGDIDWYRLPLGQQKYAAHNPQDESRPQTTMSRHCLGSPAAITYLRGPRPSTDGSKRWAADIMYANLTLAVYSVYQAVESTHRKVYIPYLATSAT
ncbi:hypothetical protein B0H13DRAFT_1853217 [Mycena leptocephala]|nr:hypothetical protein B0H13DRAFT_1853217 [Mycena leptocephala]